MVWAPAETPKRSAFKKSLWGSNKKTCEKLRGGQPLTLHRVIERDVNFINSNTKDAIIRAHDRENYHNNIVTCVKVIVIKGNFPEAESEAENSSAEN